MPSSHLLVQASHPVFRLLVLTTPTRGFPCLPEGSRCQHRTPGSGRPPSRVGVKPFFRRASHLCICRMQTPAIWPSHHRQMWLSEQHWTWLNGARIHRPCFHHDERQILGLYLTRVADLSVVALLVL